MTLLRTIAALLGWLSGALAGVGAVFYASGYLITRAQLQVFGVTGFFPLSTDHFVQEGAKFVVTVGHELLETLLELAAVALVVVAVSLALWLLLRWAPSAGAWLARVAAAGRDAVTRTHGHLPWSPALSVYLLLLALLVGHLELYRDRFAAPLRVSDVLYTAPDATRGEARDRGIRDWVVRQDTPRLHGHFTDLLDAEVRAGLLLLAAWHVTAGRPRRVLLLTPFVVTLALYTLYLPMAYGVLVRPTTYNTVALHFRAEGAREARGPFFLLSSTEQEFVVWDATARTVLWVPKTEVSGAEVQRVQNLFGTRSTDP
jgi:hypothetical protein